MNGGMRGRHLHIFGPGYSARALAAMAMGEGAAVSATVRDPSRMAALAALGIRPVEAGTALDGVTDLLISAPPAPDGCPAHRLLAAALPDLRWIGYLSSTAVYGDCGGSWIDETAPVKPRSADAKARLVAEAQWQRTAEKRCISLDVMRIAAIYGPEGRNVLGQLRAGAARAIIKPGQFFNRIHRDDIAGAALAAMRTPKGYRLTNLADGHPCAASELLCGVARMFGLPPPPEVMLENAGLPPGATGFYAENRRLRNDRMLGLPRFSLRFPDWRAGYAAIIVSEGWDLSTHKPDSMPRAT